MSYDFTCDTCGKQGTVDDGISDDGDDCPDGDCEGTVHANDPKKHERSYQALLASVDRKASSALSHIGHAEDSEVALTNDELHVLLDAVATYTRVIYNRSIDHLRTPWEEYT